MAELAKGSAFASEDTQGMAFEKEEKEVEGIVKGPSRGRAAAVTDQQHRLLDLEDASSHQNRSYCWARLEAENNRADLENCAEGSMA